MATMWPSTSRSTLSEETPSLHLLQTMQTDPSQEVVEFPAAAAAVDDVAASSSYTAVAVEVSFVASAAGAGAAAAAAS